MLYLTHFTNYIYLGQHIECCYAIFLHQLKNQNSINFISNYDSSSKSYMFNKFIPNHVAFLHLLNETVQEYQLYQMVGYCICKNHQLILNFENITKIIKNELKNSDNSTNPLNYCHFDFSNLNEYRIYSWAELILKIPFSWNYHPILCQFFFCLYFQKSSHFQSSLFYGYLFFSRKYVII